MTTCETEIVQTLCFLNAEPTGSGAVMAELVHELVKMSSLVSYSEDEAESSVKLEIAGCLGEIGAADLAVVALTGKRAKGALYYTLVSFALYKNNTTTFLFAHIARFIRSFKVIEFENVFPGLENSWNFIQIFRVV